jgi:hypothetical protein
MTFMFIAILYRWMLLSPSVQFAMNALVDWMARWVGIVIRWLLAWFPERLANALLALVRGLAEIIVSGIFSINGIRSGK